MRLRASVSITATCSAACPTVAMLRPRSGMAQWIVAERYETRPWVPAREYVDAFGNLCQRFTLPQGESTIEVQSEVEVADQIAIDMHAPPTPVESLPDDALLYLLPSRYCPSDKLGDDAADIVKATAPGYPQVDRIREWISANLTYKYGVSCESTDAIDTLHAKAGVCRDFAHVGVSLCRALRIPARTVVGYLHELDPMDLHAWFEAFVGGRWYTFDATQDSLRPGRIVVAYGRDIADVAFLSNYGPMEVTKMKVEVQSLTG